MPPEYDNGDEMLPQEEEYIDGRLVRVELLTREQWETLTANEEEAKKHKNAIFMTPFKGPHFVVMGEFSSEAVATLPNNTWVAIVGDEGGDDEDDEGGGGDDD